MLELLGGASVGGWAADSWMSAKFHSRVSVDNTRGLQMLAGCPHPALGRCPSATVLCARWEENQML